MLFRSLGSDTDANDAFGGAIATQGERLLIGAPSRDSRRGSVYSFRWDGAAWTQEAVIEPPDGAADDRFGGCIVLQGDHAIIASCYHDAFNENGGCAYLYDWTGSQWQWRRKFSGYDVGPDDYFGQGLALADGRLFVGAPLHYGPADRSGAVYTYVWNWEEPA